VACLDLRDLHRTEHRWPAAALRVAQRRHPRCAHQRRRHLRTVSSHTRSDAAIRAVDCPSAASTISARVTRRCSVRPARTRRASARRGEPVNVIRSGHDGDMACAPQDEVPTGHFSLTYHMDVVAQRHAVGHDHRPWPHRRISGPLGIRGVPGQQERLPRLGPADRPYGRRTRRRSRSTPKTRSATKDTRVN
jgi:hypothetical protein